MKGKERHNFESKNLNKLKKEAKVTLDTYKRLLESTKNVDPMYQVKEEILSNINWVINASEEPKTSPSNNEDHDTVYFYPKTNSLERVDILEYEKGGFLSWKVIVLNEKTATYDITTLVVNSHLQFLRTESYYDKMSYIEQRNQIRNFLILNEGTPIKNNLYKGQTGIFTLMPEEFSRNHVLGTFVWDIQKEL